MVKDRLSYTTYTCIEVMRNLRTKTTRRKVVIPLKLWEAWRVSRIIKFK